eukprot:gene2966-3704_t
MLLRKLRCYHFKNYRSITLNFSPQLNYIVGANGAGKTNILDAIQYLSLTKSAFNASDTQNILHGETQMSIQGQFEKHQQFYDVQCIVEQTKGKSFSVNGKVYQKLREHIGKIPLVFTTPYDMELVRGTSEVRRGFFDAILCQIDPNYLHDLLQYQQILKQRNGLLKMGASGQPIDRPLLSIYDDTLLPLCKRLWHARMAFISLFDPFLQQHYQYFVGTHELINMAYHSEVTNPDFEEQYKRHLKEDLITQRTGRGIHKDDFIFTLNGHPIKKFGSQGQQKSFVIALRLAQFSCMQQATQCNPLLLLDDIFDKLDEHRIEKLVNLISQQYFGQVWITDAGNKRSADILKSITADKALFTIENGEDYLSSNSASIHVPIYKFIIQIPRRLPFALGKIGLGMSNVPLKRAQGPWSLQAFIQTRVRCVYVSHFPNGHPLG